MPTADGGLRIGRWVIGAGALLGGALLAGRLSGLLREMELAATFGVSSGADAAVLLLTLPDLLVNLLLSGGLTAALVPRLRALAPDQAQVLMRQTLFGVLALFGGLAVLLAIWPGAWFALLAPGLPAQALPPVAALVATAAAIPLTAAAGVTTAGLNASQRFLVAGCGTLFFNLVVIAALVAGRHGMAAPLIALGLGICAGAAFRLATQLFSLPGGWLSGRPTWQSPPDRTFVRGFLAAALSASLILLVPVIVRALASTTAAGAIAAMNYALKLAELPAGVLVTSVATVALARLSGHYGGGDAAAARTSLHEGLQRSITNATGAGLVMAYFADAIVQLVLGRGAMGPTEVQRVVDLSRLLLAGLPFLAVSSMATADLNARERPQTVLRVTLACLLLLPVLALPGVVWNSEVLLAAAVVGFQAVHAAALAYASGLMHAEGRQWLNAKMAGLLGTALALVACFIALDRMFSGGHSVVRLALASLALLSIIVLPHRLLAPPRRSKDSRS